MTKSLRLAKTRLDKPPKLTHLRKKRIVGVKILDLLYKYSRSMCSRGYGALRGVRAGTALYVTGSGMEWIA